MGFEPELGQAVFSNSPWGEVDTPDYVTEGIGLLTSITAEGDWERDVTGNHGPAGNLDNGTFALRAYCWCDGDEKGHENGCPPNFQCGDFEARWYKHAGRGASQNREVTAREWGSIIVRCLRSLGITDEAHHG